MLDKETRADKLNSLNRYLEPALNNEEGAESKIIMRILPILSSKKAMKDLFQGSEAEFTILKRIIGLCIEYLKNKISKTIAQNL